MIICPKCGAWCRVLRTTTVKPSNIVRRTLECANHHRFRTVEGVQRMLRPTKEQRA